MKQPTSEQSEFTMSNEDFPALPGTQHTDGTSINLLTGGQDGSDKNQMGAAGMGLEQTDLVGMASDKLMKRGVQTSPDGKFFFHFLVTFFFISLFNEIFCVVCFYLHKELNDLRFQ